MQARTLFLLILSILFMVGCESDEVAHSENFKKIFKAGQGLFRGIALGDGMEKVRESETGKPLYDDAFGLAYKVNLEGEEECVVEYMGLEGKVESILVNAVLESEAETTALFNEVEVFLRGRHGVADGSFGGYRWRDEELGLAISLRLLADKKSFSLNFARPM